MINPRDSRGFTLVELVITIVIISALLAVVFAKLKDLSNTAETAACLANQAAIRAANQMYFAHQISTQGVEMAEYTVDKDILAEYLSHNQFPECPAGGTYTIGSDNTVACSVADHNP